MTSWEGFISESEDVKNMTAAEKKKAADKILSDIRKRKKEESEEKRKKGSRHTKYLEKQLKFKRKKYEEQKKRQKEKAKERAQREPIEAAKKSLSSIKTQKVLAKDTTATATKKSLENVASFAGGVAGAAFHGVRALAAKKRAEKVAQGKQPEKRERKSPGRPKSEGSPKPPSQSQSPSSPKQLSGKPEPKKLVPSTKRLPPTTKKLPPSGGGPYQAPPSPSRETGMSLGQRARRNPELKKRLISQRGANEMFSNWKNDFLIENDLIIEVEMNEKDKKKKIIDVMRGKNKIEINPNISEDHKEIASGKKKDDEGYMAKVELESMERAIKALRKKIKRSDYQLPAWVQSKITRAADYIDTASEYLQSSENIDEEKSPAWQREEGKSKSGGLNEKGRKSYERENPGSDLKSPSKKVGNPRRASFCARMKGMKAKLTSAKTARDPDSRINKSLRAWNC